MNPPTGGPELRPAIDATFTKLLSMATCFRDAMSALCVSRPVPCWIRTVVLTGDDDRYQSDHSSSSYSRNKPSKYCLPKGHGQGPRPSQYSAGASTQSRHPNPDMADYDGMHCAQRTTNLIQVQKGNMQIEEEFCAQRHRLFSRTIESSLSACYEHLLELVGGRSFSWGDSLLQAERYNSLRYRPLSGKGHRRDFESPRKWLDRW